MPYGIKISKSGYDADTADEQNLIFSSASNSPKIYTSGSTNLSISGSGEEDITIVTHSFGYVPAFLVYIETPANSGKMYAWRKSIDETDTTTGFWDAFSTSSIIGAVFDKDFSAAGTYPCSYIIFADDAEDNAVSRSYTGTYGMAVSNEGADISSTNLKDFSFHSNYPPLSVVATVTLSTSGDETDSVAHGLGYRPAFTGMINNTTSGWLRESPFYGFPSIPDGDVQLFEVYVDSTNVYARSHNATGLDVTYTVRLYNHEI